MYLDEHLNQIYLTEDIMKVGSLVKGKAKSISKAFGNANLQQARKILNTLPDASPEELCLAAKKKSRKYYTEAMRLVRGEKTIQQKIFCVLYTSMKGMQDALPADSRSSLNEALDKLREFAAKNAGNLMREGFILSLAMWFIAFLVYGVPIITHLIIIGATIAVFMFWFGVFLFIAKIILNSYFAVRGKSKI